MEIVLNEEKLKQILETEVIEKLKRYEELESELAYNKMEQDVISAINSCYSFGLYFDNYVRDTYPEIGNAYDYVKYRDDSDVWKIYFDLVQKYGKDNVDEIILKRFIQLEYESYKESKEDQDD